MSLRCARSAGPAVLALLLVLTAPVALGGPGAIMAAAAGATATGNGTATGSSGTATATVTGGTGSGTAGGTATAGGTGSARDTTLTLTGQSPWVKPSSPGAPATLTLTLAVPPGTPATDEVVTTLYPALHTHTAFEHTLTRAPTGTVLDRTHPVPLSGMAPAAGGRKLTVTVLPYTASTPPAGGAPTLDLRCTPATPAQCTAVYPLVVSLLRPSAGGGTTPVAHARLTTYLTYATGTSAHRLDFAWVVPVAAPVRLRAGGYDPATALSPPGTRSARALAGLAGSLAAYPAVPVTVAASPETLQGLERLGSRDGGAQAVQRLAAMSTGDQADRQFLAQPYVPVDLGALAGAGETGEITAQMTEGTSVLRSLGIQTTSSTTTATASTTTATTAGGTWVATGGVGNDLRAGMDAAGMDAASLVLPDSDLAPSQTSTTWAWAFKLPLGRGAPVTAAAADSELAAHFTADPRDPVLEANQLLADLALIHFELPNTPTPRGVVAVPPAGWTPTRAFDTALLGGLATDPVVQATTLAGYFSAFAAGAPSATPHTRRLQSGGPGPVLAASLATRITDQRLRLTAFDGAVTGTPAPAVRTHLDQLLLAAEADDPARGGREAVVATFTRVLDGQLSLVQLATERTVTLTARTGLIPVTIISRAPYTVVGTLVMSGGRFVFPHGSSRRLTLDHSANPVRIDVEARTSGDLPLKVAFEAPGGHLLIASGQLTVRSTATSLVGVVLTVLALLVLLAWWARTWHHGRRRRRATAGADRSGA